MSFDAGGATASAWCVRVATAIFGVALAAGVAPSLQPPIAPGELPGALPAMGLSPWGPLLQLLVLLTLCIAFALIGNVAARLLRESRWATVCTCAALVSSPLPLMFYGNVRHVLLHGVVAVGIVLARGLRPRFSREDVILIPVLMSCYFAFLDIGFGKTPAPTFLRAGIVVFVTRAAVGALSRAPRPALAFLLAPLALLLQMQTFPRVSAFIATAWLMVTPILLARIIRTPAQERLASRVLAFGVYPIALAAYPLAILGVGSAPYVDFFEDGHDLLPVSEMLRGERPYSDILPIHGLIADGGLSLLAIKMGAQSMGSLLRVRMVVGALNVAAIYAIALTLTGTAEAGCLAAFLALALFPWSTVWMRTIPALFSLAFAAAAARLRSRRHLMACGAALAIAFLTSVDFALYTAAIVLLVVVRWSSSLRERWRAARSVAIGCFAVFVPALIVFAIGGYAIEFFSVTVQEVLPSSRAYIIGPFAVPDCLRSISALVWQLPDPHCLSALLWLIALLASAAMLATSLTRARRSDGVAYVGLWSAVAAASWIERQHSYYEFVLPAFVVAMLFLIYRRRTPAARTTAIALTVALVLLARPFAHIFEVATPLRRSHGLPRANLVEFAGTPRARGALVAPSTERALRSVQRFLTTDLHGKETFFDFANAALLYYIFDRDCPVRYYEVPLYESDDAQMRVIATLQRNRSIRAALIAFPGTMSNIDEIPNPVRAPLVWRYLQANFVPAFEENGVVFWLRR